LGQLSLSVGIILTIAVVPLWAQTERRVALVIGNAAYEKASSLQNPVNDAKAIAESLKRLDFDVRLLLNLGKEEIRNALALFVDDSQSADWAVVYFSGHGIELDGTNYLVPTDAKLLRDVHVRFEAVPLDDLLASVSPAKTLRLVILDACRNNPFRDKMVISNGAKSVGRGLARVEPDAGTLVAYAARDGQIASDGDGLHSPYTKALLNFIEQPGLEVDFLFRHVRAAVLEETGSQEPVVYGAMPPKRLFFAPEHVPSPEVLALLAAAESATLFDDVREIDGLLQTAAGIGALDREAASNSPEMRDKFGKAIDAVERARRVVAASEEKFQGLSDAIAKGDRSGFLAGTAALTAFDLQWAGFRSTRTTLSYLPDLQFSDRPGDDGLRDELDRATKELATAQAKVDLGRGEVADLSAKIASLESAKQALEREREGLIAHAGQAMADKEQMQADVDKLTRRLSEGESQIRVLTETRDRLSTDLTRQQSELDELKRKAGDLEGELLCTYAKDEANRILGWSAYGTAYGDFGGCPLECKQPELRSRPRGGTASKAGSRFPDQGPQVCPRQAMLPGCPL
jgi:uncharacterized caspase-like protein